MDAPPQTRATNPGYRSGAVALCGRPNVGKSTLLNALLGEELAVATALPQTTRERMLGIWTTDRFQAVLVDTPGIHRAKSALNRFMVDEAMRGAKGVDLILMLAEVPSFPAGPEGEAAVAEWEPGPGAREAVERLAETGTRMALVLTKCDLLGSRDLLFPIIAKWQAIHSFDAVIPVSALQGGAGLEALRVEVENALPERPAQFDSEQLTDRNMRWHASELIRGELFARLGQELPYSCAVTISNYKELRARDLIEAVIHVERTSQKGIVIGAKGRTIKAISMGARARIEALAGRPCELFVEVRVTPGWSKDPKKLEDLGYRVALAPAESSYDMVEVVEVESEDD